MDEKPETDPEALERKLAKLKLRLKRHNLIVQRLAALLESEGASLFENPFDCLGCFNNYAFLFEVKSLDGSEPDEVSRVRDALSQLLYYEAFVTAPYVDGYDKIQKVACFEKKIQDKHIEWLSKSGIVTIWVDDKGFNTDNKSRQALIGHLGF